MKKRLWKLFLTAVFILFMAGNATAALQLIYPAEKSWVHRADYIILKTNDQSITGVRITINGIDSDIIQIGDPEYRKMFQDILILQPVWDKGKNTLLIEGFSGTQRIQSINTEVFFNPSGEASFVPKEYLQNIVHVADKENICNPCHAMVPEGGKSVAVNTGKSPCASCHKNKLKASRAHEPVRNSNCEYCHNGSGNPKHKVLKRDAPLCYECHADKAADIKKFTISHGPIAAGYCEICHDPHGTDFPALMRKPINEVCLACHEKIGKSPHVVRTSGSEGHPLSGAKDMSPKRSGKDLSCASCHDPHGGMVRYFFTSRSKERMALCQFCHGK